MTTSPVTATLDEALAHIQQRFGSDIIRSGASLLDVRPDPLPTGIEAFDILTGGFPRGAVSVIAGDATSGAATLALTGLRAAQQQHKPVVVIDPGATFDADYAAFCGVDAASLVVIRSDDAVTGLSIARDLVAATELGAVWFDGNGMSPTANRLAPILANTACAFLVTGHWSASPALRLSVRRAGWLVDADGDVYGWRSHVTVAYRRGDIAGGCAEIDMPLDPIRRWRR